MTSTGHGAAAWIAIRMLETSYRARTSSGSLSIRTNIVGTHWLCVTRYVSIAASDASASKRVVITSVPPRECTMPPNRSGAAWYVGAAA